MIWDTHNTKLLRVLAGFSGPVLSVSINHLSGNIVVLTTAKLGVYTVNGNLLSTVAMSRLDSQLDLSVPIHGTPQQGLGANYSHVNSPLAFKVRPRVVIAPPTADWQDGVVAVTGHETGLIFLWKMQTVTSLFPFEENQERLSPSILLEKMQNLHPKIESDNLDDEEAPHSSGHVRRILVPYSTLRTHKADISVLKLSPWSLPKTRPLVPRHYDGENGLELLVGDVEGNISRWDTSRLEQLSAAEINSLAMRYSNQRSVRLGSTRTIRHGVGITVEDEDDGSPELKTVPSSENIVSVDSVVS